MKEAVAETTHVKTCGTTEATCGTTETTCGTTETTCGDRTYWLLEASHKLDDDDITMRIHLGAPFPPWMNREPSMDFANPDPLLAFASFATWPNAFPKP